MIKLLHNTLLYTRPGDQAPALTWRTIGTYLINHKLAGLIPFAIALFSRAPAAGSMV